MSSRAGRIAVMVAAVALATACGTADVSTSASGHRLRVVATTTQVADFARNVGGDRVEVHQILEPNVDPHDYEATPADMLALAGARVVVENGVGLEAWLHRAIANSGFHGRTVDTSRGVRVRTAGGGRDDPHIWQNPRNAEIMCADIEKAFARADPRDADYFRHHLHHYRAELVGLDRWIARRIASVPSADRKLVTNHDAFGYYVARYHLRFEGSIIPSFDSSAQMSGKSLSRLIARIGRTHTPAIFSESSLPPKTARSIARQAHVRVEAGEDSLYGDTLGPKGSSGSTYLRMERHNTTTIVRALSPHEEG